MSVNSILDQFNAIASNPAGQLKSYLKDGKKVVGVAPVYAPEEIIHSMGLVPMGIWGADGEVQEAKRYFPAFICSIMQSLLEQGMKGTYKGISAIAIPSLCDSLKTVGQNWKCAVPSIPFIPMTYPQNRANEAGTAFVKAGYLRVIADLEQATGAAFSDKALFESIKVYNDHNAAMRQVCDVLALHPEVNARVRNDVFKSATFMLKEEHTALVRALLCALETVPITDSKVKIVTSGILCDSPALLKIIDDCGMQIVADDVAAESRQYRTDAPDAPTALDSLSLKFSQMGNCSVLYDPDKTRADLIVTTAKAKKAKGVVVILTKFCDPEEFDYVIIKKACDQADLPVALVEVDRQMVKYEQAKTLLETFKEML